LRDAHGLQRPPLGGRNPRDEIIPRHHDRARMNDLDADLRKKLTPEQYRVCLQNGTEPPFRNAYWDNHAPGLYVDVISGEPLFASVHKFDSGTGWPSFFQPLESEAIVEKDDTTHGMKRIEVRSRKSDAHLGHVFPDGPKPTGRRYCINSASLRFIPAERLKAEGYEKYARLFETP
jgi:methionine-R-sulfoxide reductase